MTIASCGGLGDFLLGSNTTNLEGVAEGKAWGLQ